MHYTYFTSESVAAGHPDKLCDQICDAILDACIFQDEYAHTAIECLVTVNHLTLAGEVKSYAKIDYIDVARQVIKKIGYTNPLFQFTYRSPIDNFIHEQSKDIAVGVDKGGAGDQGMMFGYAVDETPELMPLPIILAHRLVEQLDIVKQKKNYSYLRPDGKSQVVVKYEKGKPKDVERVILAVPYDPKISKERLKRDILIQVVKPVLSKYGYDCGSGKLIVNGTGRWEIGGPFSDTGLSGRKIMVDSYGAMGRHGGGSFSGKDPTKVDRIGAYAVRYIAKNIVAHKMASRCEVQIAYVIGRKNPIAKAIETFGTNTVDLAKIEKFAWGLLDLSVSGIINCFNLLSPIYLATACYGHFGRSNFPWEQIVH